MTRYANIVRATSWGRSRSGLLFALSLLLIFGALVTARVFADHFLYKYEIHLTLVRSTGEPVGLTITGDRENRVAVAPNQRQRLFLRDGIKSGALTFSIPNPACSDVIFHVVTLRKSDETLIYAYGPRELQGIVGFHLSLKDDGAQRTGDGLRLRICDDPERFVIPVPAAASTESSACRWCGGYSDLLETFSTREAALAALEFAILVLLISLAARRGISVALVLVSYGMLCLAVFGASRYLAFPDPIHTAVGHAGYYGRSTFANVAALFLATGVAALIALAAALIDRREPLPATDPVARPASSRRGRRTFALVLSAALVLFLAGYIAAPLIGSIIYPPGPHGEHWDNNNIIFWNFLAHYGLRPLKDFWYPYGGQWLFALPAPKGEAWTFAVFLANYLLFYFALARLTGSVAWAALCTVMLVGFDVSGVTPLLYRYILAVNVALCHGALVFARREPWTSVAFFTAILLALLIEPVQLFYASAALAAIKLGAAAIEGGGWRAFLRGDHRDVIVGAAAAAVFVAYLLLDGMLVVFIRFQLSLGAQVSANAEPADIMGALTRWNSGSLMILLGPVVLIAIGLYWFLRTGIEQRRMGVMLAALGFVGLFVVQKHLMRPNDWIMMPPTIAAMLLLIGWRLRSARPLEAVALALGIAVVLLHLSVRAGFPERMLARSLQGLSLISQAVAGQLMLNPKDDLRYALNRFVRFENENAVMSALRARSPDGQMPSFYAIGDAPLIYLLAGQKPPYHTNDYNASPIAEQRLVVEWLRRTRPEYAVWRSSDLTFDGFQRVVRDPLMYAEVIDTFVPLQEVGAYSLMRRRGADEPIAWDWWRERLKPEVDFGYLLRASKPDKPCGPEAGEACGQFLEVSVAETVQPGTPLVIPVEAAGRTFSIRFVVDSGSRYYRIPLHRVWFWNLAQRHGLSRRVVLEAIDTRAMARLSSQLVAGKLY
jgi:hypothetical protein